MIEKNKTDIRENILKTLSKFSKIRPEKIKMEDRLCEDLKLDSLERMEVFGAICDEHKIDPDLEKVVSLSTVGQVLDFMESSI